MLDGRLVYFVVCCSLALLLRYVIIKKPISFLKGIFFSIIFYFISQIVTAFVTGNVLRYGFALADAVSLGILCYGYKSSKEQPKNT